MTPKRPAKKIKAKPKATRRDLPKATFNCVAAMYDELVTVAREVRELGWKVQTNSVMAMGCAEVLRELGEVVKLREQVAYQRAVIDRLTRERKELNETVKRLGVMNHSYFDARIELADDTPNPLHDIERREAMRKGIDEACK